VPKKDKESVRLCVDLTGLNVYVGREKYILRSVDQSLGMLAGAKFFSKLGFWQIPLTKDSSMYNTFITPFGRFQFNHLPFGIASAAEHFQQQTYAIKHKPGAVPFSVKTGAQER
jgi:hypothetical protein